MLLSPRVIAFIDAFCPKPYTPMSIRTEALGGTEATCARITHKLAQLGHSVVLFEQGQVADCASCDPNLVISPWTGELPGPVDAVVVLRQVALAHAISRRYPLTPHIYSWLHDLPDTRLVQEISDAIGGGFRPRLICVSKFHKEAVRKALGNWALGCDLYHIYNPLDPEITRYVGEINPYKLAFFSSPHKGLDRTLKLFAGVRATDPRFELFVGNPGYFNPQNLRKQDGVHILGPLPHAEMLKHVGESLCTFYPNNASPETFGLVMAESDAVGTPVMTHDLGAAREVLFHPGEIVGTGFQNILMRLLAWSQGARPRVKARTEFRLDIVAAQWEKLLR